MDDVVTIKDNIVGSPVKESYKVRANGICFCRDYGNGIESARIVIPKETFIMAYKAYILGNTETEK